MGIWDWFWNNAFNLLTVAVAVGSLWFTAASLRSETKTRRIANLLAITANHREVWKVFLESKELARVRDPKADTARQPVTDAEWVFVNLVIQHVNSVYQTMNGQLVATVEGLRRDIARFLSLPIPSQVWDKLKALQNGDFVAFVESCLNQQ